MKIQRIGFMGVRGVGDVSFDLTDPGTGLPHDTIVVSGPSASGKTRFLEAIAAAKEVIGPYGPPSTGAPWIPAGSYVSKVTIAFRLDEEEQVFAGASTPILEAEAAFLPTRTVREADEGLVALLERYDHEGRSGKIEYFPSNRRLPTHGPFHGTSALEQRLLRTSKDPRKYSFIPRFLRDLEDDPARAGAFESLLAALSPTCRYTRGTSRDGLPRCLASRGGGDVPVTELSDAEADAVILAATATAFGLSRSLVLVDRPDLFTEPGQAKTLLAGLRGLGEQNQIFLASSSPEIAAAAAPGLVIRLGRE